MNSTPKSKKTIRSVCVNSSEFRLYDSLKHIGLIQPLVYVRNDDTQNFELFGGGRRRLKLLDAVQKELKRNGQDPVPVPTIVRDQTVSGGKIELSHLIQNYVRRRRKFIDRALHLNDCVECREREIARAMSQRETVRWLRENGFPISQSLLSDMLFTAKTLCSVLPNALGNGLGRRHIVNIRKLYRAMREIWITFGEDLNDFHEAFEDICKECDHQTFDIELFLEVMEREVCLWCGLNSQYVSAMLMVNQKERAHLIESIVTSDRRCAPMTRSRPRPARSAVANIPVAKPKSNCKTPLFDLPPTIIKRRKRYARSLAIDLARSLSLLGSVSGSIGSAMGYSILYPPTISQAATVATWQFLYFCQHTVQSTDMNSQRVRAGWRLLDQNDFGRVFSLVEVTRTLHDARQIADPITQLQVAA